MLSKRWLVFFCLLSFVSIAHAELEVFALQHRSAEDLLPVLQPLVRGDGAINGMNNQLIVRGTASELRELKALLEQLDVAPRSLRITVLQEVDRATVQRVMEWSGSTAGGGLSVPQSQSVRGLQAGSNHLRGSADEIQRYLSDKKTQQLQVIEGGRAWVQIGQSVPVEQVLLTRTPWGEIRRTQAVQYRALNSGFYVQPRLQGQSVTLDITAQNDSMDANQSTQNMQQLHTRVSGKLGAWLVLGDVVQQSEQGQSSLNAVDNVHLSEQRNVLLLVEEISAP